MSTFRRVGSAMAIIGSLYGCSQGLNNPSEQGDSNNEVEFVTRSNGVRLQYAKCANNILVASHSKSDNHLVLEISDCKIDTMKDMLIKNGFEDIAAKLP